MAALLGQKMDYHLGKRMADWKAMMRVVLKEHLLVSTMVAQKAKLLVCWKDSQMVAVMVYLMDFD